jgi:hypothetical protein
MRESDSAPVLSPEYWNATRNEVISEMRSFVDEFGSFTPEWFAEVKFHLIRQVGLHKDSRTELCRVSIHSGLCGSCDSLYVAKECLLWSRLFREIRWSILDRSPPCIRLAFRRKNIRKVADFLSRAGLIDPPFYRAKMAPTCKGMRRWGYCRPDEYCKAMTTERTLEYASARDRVKISRPSTRKE